MIFAAGLGTRLKPLTKKIPKALVKLNGIPLLEHIISNFKNQGFNHFVINVHHFADQIEAFLVNNKNFGSDIQISDEREQLLETGGGLLKAENLLKDAKLILLHNADIISDINFKSIIDMHLKNDSLATLAVQKRESSRKLLFNDENYLCQWKNIKTGELKISRMHTKELYEWSFSGIHIINPKIFDYIKETGKFSIIDLYLRLAKNHKISAFETDHTYWYDLGKQENIKEAEEHLKLIH